MIYKLNLFYNLSKIRICQTAWKMAWTFLILVVSVWTPCLLSIWRQKKRSGVECGEVTFPILGCHWSLKRIVLFDDKIPYYPFPSHTSTTCGGITRYVMGQRRVKALPFLSNSIARALLCSVFSFIALEAETHSRCDLPGLPQGHSQVEVLWLACGDPKVSKGGGLSL